MPKIRKSECVDCCYEKNIIIPTSYYPLCESVPSISYFTDKEVTAQQNVFGEISNPTSDPSL